MRNRFTMTAAALLLSSQLGMAQTQPSPQTPQAPGPTAPSLGSIDFGFRGTGTDDDEARYERYQDLRNGAFSRFAINNETATYFVDANAFNVGYRDQKYALDYRRNKLRFNFLFDSTPTNFSYLTVSPWNVGDDGVLTIPRELRLAVQGNPNSTSTTDGVIGVPCAPGGAAGQVPPTNTSACNPTTAPLVLANRSIYRNNLQQFDLRYKRETTTFGAVYSATPNVDVNVNFTTTGRNGYQPWGASFAFNNANEVPLPLDQRTNDFGVGGEWANARGMFRLGYDGSWFNNDVQTLVWDNPIFADNFTNGLAPPLGPYDPNGYSNGNGPAQGRQALMPSNNMHVISATGMYRLPNRTSINGTLQFTRNNQDEALIPWTINPVIAQAPTYVNWPQLAALPRQTAQAEVRGVNALVNFTTRPWRNLGFQARYRYNDRENNTPHFDATEYVRFDAVPEPAEHGISEYYQVTRQTFDVNANYNVSRWGSLRVGYSHDGYDREGRGLAELSDNSFRASWDTLANQYLSIRAQYEFIARRGEGFVLTGTDYETGPGATQPTLRYFDESDRDRNRGSVIFTVMPTNGVDVYFTFAGTSDEYMAGEEVPTTRESDELFGLLEQDITSWNLGVNFQPGDKVGFGASYGRENYSTLQLSRNANPNCREDVPPCAPGAYNSWTDPNRNWTLDNGEDVNNFNLFLDVTRAIRNTDIRVSYDFSDSNNSFDFGGPRVAQLNDPDNASLRTPGDSRACAAGVSDCFIPVPAVTNKWHRLTADVKYFFRSNVGIGLGYWFESFDVEDWATIDAQGAVGFQPETNSVRVDYLGGLITGYAPRDYTGNTVFLRLLYLF